MIITENRFLASVTGILFSEIGKASGYNKTQENKDYSQNVMSQNIEKSHFGVAISK